MITNVSSSADKNRKCATLSLVRGVSERSLYMVRLHVGESVQRLHGGVNLSMLTPSILHQGSASRGRRPAASKSQALL